MHSDVAIIIPSRLNSTRLTQKPLQLIGNITMIEHVLSQVQSTGLKNIFVATDSNEIAEKVTGHGGQFIFTPTGCTSGTDRVYEAFQLIPDNHNINYILNVQGDMPFIDPKIILSVIENLKSSTYDIMTPVTKVGLQLANSNSNVKVITDNNNRALYFSRSVIPYGANEFLYHIGVYGFRKKALGQFVKLPSSSLEQSENLEQLRALENNMTIGVCYVNNIPISVDTEADLRQAIKFHQLQ
ncbi:3-deoxy-manno-octulosonate cytidylyltransferase [Candidatus Tisiphia endosymbiont of Beris chalybata]|uniref:3-deoxy-manno-octulosonate cytidylyltransferase n=1 Tax=Candidatus Tisiphia endosymbiont of Beris chalybata TaxID=3066262 RepID=UPI00312CBC01